MKKEVYSEAVEKGRQLLLASDPAKLAELGGGRLEQGRILLPYLGEELAIDAKTGEFDPALRWDVEKFVVYQYLTEAMGVPGPGQEFLSFLQLPQGEHHYAPLKLDVLEPLARLFGGRLDDFSRACESLGGVKVKGGDRAYQLPYFPKVALRVAVWAGDEEFPPNAVMLFDNKCKLHLTTGALFGVAMVAFDKLKKGAK